MYLPFILRSLLPTTLVVLVAGHVIDRRSDCNPEQDVIQEIIQHDRWLNQDTIETTSHRSPSVEIIPAALDLWGILSSKNPTYLDASKDVDAKMHVLDSLADETQEQAYLYDNSEGDSDILSLFTTHGVWVFMLSTKSADEIMLDMRNQATATGKDPAKMHIRGLESFKRIIDNVVISDNHEDSRPDNLKTFIRKVRAAGGTFWRINIVYNKERLSGSRLGTKRVMTAVKERIIKLTDPKGMKRPVGGLTAIMTPWAPGAEPFVDPANRKFMLTFFYNEQSASWNGITMFGPQTCIFLDSGEVEEPEVQGAEVQGAKVQGAEVQGAEVQGAGEDECSDDGGIQIHRVIWAEGSSSVHGFQNIPPKQLKYRGAAVVVIASTGYCAIFLTPTAFRKISNGTPDSQRLFEEASKEIREKLKTAINPLQNGNGQGLQIVTLLSSVKSSATTPLTRTDENIYRGDYLDSLLDLVTDEAAPLFNGRKFPWISVIHADQEDTPGQSQLTLRSDHVNSLPDLKESGVLFEILYGDRVQLSVGFGQTRNMVYSMAMAPATIGQLANSVWVNGQVEEWV